MKVFNTYGLYEGQLPFDAVEKIDRVQTEEYALRSCGTCRERRIRCDRVNPVCSQCTRAGKVCKGYGIRLSWPSLRDSRRLIVARSAYRQNKARLNPNTHLVDITSWDIDMHNHLSSSSKTDHTQPRLCIPMPFSPFISGDGDKALLQYFQSAAATSLSTVGHKPTDLGNTLLRIAFSGSTASALAVFRLLLALSSLHRYGVQSQAFELKIAGIKALAEASNNNLGSKEVIQHIAAGMLLCTFEVHQASCTSGQWVKYIAGIKQVIGATTFDDFRRDGDLAVLMDWLYYHDVLARFTLRHYRGEISSTLLVLPETWTGSFNPEPSDLALLRLLSEISETVTSRSRSGQNLIDYKSYLEVLDWRIRKVPISCEIDAEPETLIVLELFQLAILVYLNRVSNDLLDQTAKIQALVRRAFHLISRISGCERQFPIFIFGCEARSDEDRTAIMDLVLRTDMKASSRSLKHVQILIQRIWAQDDLAEQELDYTEKLTTIISCFTIAPSLV